MKLYNPKPFDQPNGKYTIIQAPTGNGKTWEVALLYLKKLAESQAQKEEDNSQESSKKD